MGQLLAEALCKALEESGRRQKDIATSLGIGANLVCDYHNNKKTPGFSLLGRLADAYRMTYGDVVRLWLLDKAETSKAKDRLVAELFSPAATVPADSIEGLVSALSTHRNVHQAAKKVVDHLHKSKQSLDASAREVLTALKKLREVQVIGERSPTSKSCVSADWTPLLSGSKIAKCTVFAAKRPTPVVAELHKFPAGIGGVHRQPELSDSPACYELWCVAAGRGHLLVQDETGWVDCPASTGSCGYYWSAHRHVWINFGLNDPLIVFHLFFPYRQTNFGKDGPGEAIEFSINDMREPLAQDVQTEVRRIMRSQKKGGGGNQ